MSDAALDKSTLEQRLVRSLSDSDRATFLMENR